MKRKPARGRALGPIHGRITELREQKGLTLEALADLVGISKGAVWHWENGDARPSIANLPALAEALGVSVPELIEGEKAFAALSEMIEAKAS